MIGLCMSRGESRCTCGLETNVAGALELKGSIFSAGRSVSR